MTRAGHAAGLAMALATAPALTAMASPALAAGSYLSPSARLEHETIGLEQVTVLVIEVKSDDRASVAFEPDFRLENLEIVGRPSRSNMSSFTNGRLTRSDALIWTLRPLAVGPAHVKVIRVTIEERIFVLDDLSLEVQEEPVEMEQPRARRSPFDDLEEMLDPFGRRRGRRPEPAPQPKVFLRAEATPRDPYVGQQVLYTLYLFTQADVAAIEPAEMPEFNGLWVHELPESNQRSTVLTDVGDERYGRAVMLRKALFPLRAGEIEIGPMSARMAIKVPASAFYGPLLDRVEQIQRTSNKVALDVRPLPPAPAGYDGAVGRLDLQVDLEPAELEVGEAASLKVTLEGEGHIQGLEAPELAQLEGLRRFPPEQSGGSTITGHRVRGKRTWTYVLVPDAAGRWELGPIDYPYFDPAAGEYRVATSEPRVLLARPEKVASVETPKPAAPETETAPKPAAGPFRSRPWLFGLVALVPVLLVLALRGVRGGARHRQETRELKERLRTATETRRPRRAAEQVEAAWREYLTRRWQIDSPGGADGWGDLLEERGVEPAAAEQMDRLAEDLRYLRLAPELSSTRAVRQDLLQRSLRLLRRLG